MNYISLFSGAGGLDIGIERSGFKAISMCENEKTFCDTLKSNIGWTHSDGHRYFNDAKILNVDIKNVIGSDLSFGRDIDLLVGGPPCQPFSNSGKRMSVLDPRGLLISEFHRMVSEVKPKAFLFENVRGLISAMDESGNHGGVLLKLMKDFGDLGYSCRVDILNSADFGSFQRRVRCFIIGSRHGAAPEFPPPTSSRNGGWKSLSDFLRNSADQNTNNYVYPTDALSELFIDIPNGCGIKSKGRIEATRPNGHWGYRQGTFISDISLPARTVTGSSSQDWIRWDDIIRRLTLNEVKLLQGFPDDWIIKGNKSQQYKQVGNAVPSIFGEVLGSILMEHLTNQSVGDVTRIDIPEKFKLNMRDSKRDHDRNKLSRVVKHFNESVIKDEK